MYDIRLIFIILAIISALILILHKLFSNKKKIHDNKTKTKPIQNEQDYFENGESVGKKRVIHVDNDYVDNFNDLRNSAKHFQEKQKEKTQDDLNLTEKIIPDEITAQKENTNQDEDIIMNTVNEEIPQYFIINARINNEISETNIAAALNNTLHNLDINGEIVFKAMQEPNQGIYKLKDKSTDNEIIFHVANMKAPGTFNVKDEDNLTKGITFYMCPPFYKKASYNYDIMHNFAKLLATKIDAQLFNHKDQILDEDLVTQEKMIAAKCN